MADVEITQTSRIIDFLQENSTFALIKSQIHKKLKAENLKELLSKIEIIQLGSKIESIQKDKPEISNTQTKIEKILKSSKKLKTKFNLCIENSAYLVNLSFESKKIEKEAFKSSENFSKVTQKFLELMLNQTSEMLEKININQKDIFTSCSKIYSVTSLLNFFSISSKSKFSNLKTLPNNFFNIQTFYELREYFAELDYDKFEHIEQNFESEKVEFERISEGEEILETSSKNEDEEEILSFFKAGVPNGLKNKFYSQYFEVFIKKISPQDSEVSSIGIENEVIRELNCQISDNLALVEELIQQNALLFMNNNEYFPYENSLKKLMIYYFKNFDLFVPKNKPFYIGFLPFGTLESFLMISSVVSMSLKNCQKFFKVVFNKIYVPMFDFEENCQGNLIVLCQIFESLFLTEMNDLFFHLRMIGLNPLDFASQWISTLFVGYLRTQEVLYLIDRVLGFESLIVLPLTALGIFKHFEEELKEAKTADDVHNIFWLWNISAIKVLNLVLF